MPNTYALYIQNMMAQGLKTKEVAPIAGYSIRAASLLFKIVLYFILKTISLEQLTTERQVY
jgi:hypothetical protein